MKIIIVGASGTIGKTVAGALEKEHEIIRVGSKSGDIQADITSPQSIEEMFKKAGKFDALVSAAGAAYFGPWKGMDDAAFRIGINSKLMGQVNLVLIGQYFINPNGSFTLTAGSLAHDPVLAGSNASVANGALESFARAAAIELGNGIRINVVSPTVVEDSPAYFPYFPGHVPVSMKRVEYAYLKSILGAGTGKVITVI